MKTKLLFFGILISGITFSQDTSNNLEISETKNTLTIHSNAHIVKSPDLVTIQITLTEYVHTDPTSQETTSIELSTIKKTLLEKLKELGVDESALKFASMLEGNNHYNYNNSFAINYNTTQKKSLSAAYNLKWTASEKELQRLFETLRFNGITSIVLQCDYSDELDAEIRQELLESCIKEGKKDALIAVEALNMKLGEVVSLSNYTNENNMPVYSGGNIYYNNSLIPQKHTSSATIIFELLK